MIKCSFTYVEQQKALANGLSLWDGKLSRGVGSPNRIDFDEKAKGDNGLNSTKIPISYSLRNNWILGLVKKIVWR